MPNVNIIDQFRAARRHPIAALLGALLGGVVPLVTYVVAHYELRDGWIEPRAALVAGGLAYSAKTVWQWGRLAFKCPWKATGFVLLLEGVMVLSSIPWLARLALSYLMGINAVATACTIAHDDKPAAPEPEAAPIPTVTAVARQLGVSRKEAIEKRQAARARPVPTPRPAT